MKRSLLALLAGLLVAALAACERSTTPFAGPQYGSAPASSRPVYRLAVHPLHNPEKLVAAYQPLVDYLGQQIPEVRFELEASRDYQAYEQKFRARAPEFLLPNPWQTLEAIKVGYRVIAMAGDAEDFKGIFIVRRDSGIRKPADLKGKAVSYPSHTALAACVMPQDFLHKHGIDIRRDIKNLYVGSQESSIMNAYLGKSAAAATWPLPWRLFQRDHPNEAAALEVIWETPSLLNNSFMVRDDVPTALAEKIAALLIGLEHSAQGRAILANMETARFHPASDASYDLVRRYIAAFERDVRPVAEP
ncbi:MAG: phosphate/phosphite/phosphonate ABC transporter substrate-binding protein [Rhodocyclaceae bacterium]|nr:phosphate/phosphite/phosphonate ABC transporter substrate-binding protein [Rhodocyclaceae bacterium]